MVGEDRLSRLYDRYEAYMRESVAGLSVNSTVKYRGVDVGRVKAIDLNPNNPEEVLLTMDIMRGPRSRPTRLPYSRRKGSPA